MPFKRAFKQRWIFDHKSSHTEIWNIWNYWNYCCGIAFETGINTTICCGLEYLHTTPCCWGSRGREFKSRHSDQKVQIIVWLSVLFYFAYICAQRLELPRRRRTQSGFCEANLWAEPTSLVTRTKQKRLAVASLFCLVQLSLPSASEFHFVSEVAYAVKFASQVFNSKLNITLHGRCKTSLCFSATSLWA